MLHLIATPIGNLKDITIRALETLKEADGIICEDTRRTGVLLTHYQIKKNLTILNDFNEVRQIPSIIQRLKNGENLALVSDAGTPLISDPGYKLVRQCLEDGIEVDSLPGPSSIVTALTLSSLPPDKFTFLGYPPDKSGNRQKLYQAMQESSNSLSTTFILFIAPFKLVKTLAEMQNSFGDIEITLAKELTKIHQNISRKKISEWIEQFKSQNPKGEFIALLRF